MANLTYFFVFIFGAVVGSFLNVVILRYNTGESIIRGGSKCLACAKKLKWHELIPIFSFLAQKGRCRECQSRISLQYPIVELITGIIFVLIFNLQFTIYNQFSVYNFSTILYYWTIFSFLVIIAVYDYYHQIIPDLFVYIFIALAFFNLFGILDLGFISDLGFRISDFAIGFILFTFFALMWLVSRGIWMGFGDAKLALGIGWLLGMEKGILATILSFWIGAIVGVFLLLWSKRKSGGKYDMKTRVAFGPFLVLGTIIAFFAGDALVRVFLHNLMF